MPSDVPLGYGRENDSEEKNNAAKEPNELQGNKNVDEGLAFFIRA